MIKLHRLLAVLIACLVGATALAGPLDPPAGPVEGTFKTLSEVEPRIAINAQNTPGDALNQYVITQPGSYYLTEDLVVNSLLSGILVAADGVTVDLNGFSLDGQGGGFAAISTANVGVISQATIRNGTIRGWDRAFFVAFNGATLESLQIADCTKGIDTIVSDFVRVSDCSTFDLVGGALNRDGIVLGQGALVERCMVSTTTEIGISVLSGTIRDCTLSDHTGPTRAAIRIQNQGIISGCIVDTTTRGIAGSAVTVSNCTVRNATGNAYELGATSSVSGSTAVKVLAGFVAGTGSTLTNCAASGFQQEGFDVGDGCSLSNCTASSSPAATARGFVTGVSATLNNCTAYDIGGNGFETFSGTTFFNCTARNCDANGFVCATGTVLNGCSARGNGVDGFDVGSGSRIVDCSSTVNGNNGFQISVDVHILNSSADDNVGIGINAEGSDNRIEGNNLTDNLTGLQVVLNGGCLIIGNSASGNTTNFNIPTGNQAGPIGSAATATSPWANLAF